MKISTQILVCLGILLVGVIPDTVQAQDEGVRTPFPHKQVISANPFLFLGEWFNVEYERKLSPTTTVGIAGSIVSFDDGDEDYKSLNGIVRYYPSEAALSGFYLGGRFGFHQVTEDDEEGHAYGLGVDVGYAWLLGSKRNFYIGLGIGATRLFGGDVEEDRVVLPSVRLVNIGVAF